MSIIERIYLLSDFKGDSIYKLSKDLGVSNGYFSKQRQSNGAISSVIIEKIVNYYPDVNSEWLLTGKGGMLKKENNKILLKNNTLVDQLTACINRLNKLIQAIESICSCKTDTEINIYQYKQIIKDNRIFVNTVTNNLQKNIQNLQEDQSIKETDKQLSKNIIKCNYCISALTENLLQLIQEVCIKG